MTTEQMIKSCVTIALVPELKTGPWIFWQDLEAGMAKASTLGFDAIELFTPSADAIDKTELHRLLTKYNLALAAVGTGAGKVLHGLTLTDPEPAIRKKAIIFISEMIEFGGDFGAPAIIGSMQGNILPGNKREETLAWLRDGLNTLGEFAADQRVDLIYEPLNRYESNLCNTLESGSKLLDDLETNSVKLLADLFHMNIEEANLEESILNWGGRIGHVHFADSNRRPIGFGHTAMKDVADALQTIEYDGYVSAEAFPYPSPDEAAAQTIAEFRKWFRNA